jgi:hypothetical protein
MTIEIMVRDASITTTEPGTTITYNLPYPIDIYKIYAGVDTASRAMRFVVRDNDVAHPDLMNGNKEFNFNDNPNEFLGMVIGTGASYVYDEFEPVRVNQTIAIDVLSQGSADAAVSFVLFARPVLVGDDEITFDLARDLTEHIHQVDPDADYEGSVSTLSPGSPWYQVRQSNLKQLGVEYKDD